MGYEMRSENLKIFVKQKPYSTDPLDYDAFVHHVVFTSVLSPLVSSYKLGEIRGLIAESWQPEDYFRKWTFKIRKNLNFEDGESINAEAVYKNLNRVAFLMHKKGSASGVFEHLVGFEKLKSASSPFPGLVFGESTVTLNFVKSMPNLLLKMGFGLYAIASPLQFDSLTGEWDDKKKLVASGPYRISEWNESQLILKIRENYPRNFIHPKAFQEVQFSFVDPPEKLSAGELAVARSDSLLFDDKTQFHGPLESMIYYYRCSHWNDKSHFLGSRENRVLFREALYRNLRDSGFNVVRSFFPLAIAGIKEFPEPKLQNMSLSQISEIVTPEITTGKKSRINQHKVSLGEAHKKAFEDLAKEVGAKLTFNKYPVDAFDFNFGADVFMLLTGVLIDHPHHDVRFMLLSKEGIQLPDETGEIKVYVKQEKFDIQDVNRMLWEQAIVWPIGHRALGLWTAQDTSIDLSLYNTTLPPLDLQWIGSKK